MRVVVELLQALAGYLGRYCQGAWLWLESLGSSSSFFAALLSPSYGPDGGYFSAVPTPHSSAAAHIILSFTDFCSVFPRFNLSSLSSHQYFCQHSLVSVLLELPPGGEQGKKTAQVQVLGGNVGLVWCCEAPSV